MMNDEMIIGTWEMLQNRLEIAYHKVDEVVSGVTVVDKLIVDDDEVFDGAFVVVSKHYVVRPEVTVRQGMQWTRRGVLRIRMRSMHLYSIVFSCFAPHQVRFHPGKG